MLIFPHSSTDNVVNSYIDNWRTRCRQYKTHEHRFFLKKSVDLLWPLDQSCRVYLYWYLLRMILCYKMTHGTEANDLLHIFMFPVAKLIIAEIIYRVVTGWPVINEPKWMLKRYCPDLKVLYSSHNLIWRRCAAHLKCSTAHNFITIVMWTGWVLTAASLSPACEEQQEGSLFY